MNPPFTFTAALGVVAVGFATGWILNRPDANRPEGNITPVDRGGAAAWQPQVSSPPPVAGSESIREFASRLDDLANMRAPFRRARAIDAIADGLNAAEVRAAIAAIETQALRDREQIRLQLLARWAELEPEAALEYARKLPSGTIAPGAIQTVIKSWFATDAGAAEEGIGKMPESLARQIAWANLVECVAETNLERAFTMMRGTTLSGFSIDSVFERWAQIDPEEVAAQAALLPSGYSRDSALRRASEKFATADRERALAWALSLSGRQFEGATIDRREPGPLAAVLRTWMNEDRQAALEWLEALPNDFAKVDVLAFLSRELADKEPDKAVEVAVMMPAGGAQDSALRRLVEKWATKDFSGALTWAQEQDAEARRVLLPPLVQQLASRDALAALELAASIDGQAGEQAVDTALGIWTLSKPEAAATWAAAQPESASYLASIAPRWARMDESQAREWLAKLPDGATKDGALLSGILRLARSDQAQAAERWIEEISDQERRAAAYQEFARWWLRWDSKKAREWIRTAPIPAETKSELLTRRIK